LPSKWAAEHKIRKGDEISVEQVGRRLVLNTEGEITHGNIQVNLNEEMPFSKRYLRVLYELGYDEICFHSEESLPLEDINEKLNELLGFEIIENKEKYCLIRNIAKGADEDFDVVFRRLFYMVISMSLDILEALKQQRQESLKKIQQTEVTVNKIASFCHRILNTHPHAKDHKTPFLYLTVDLLEQIGDDLDSICQQLASETPKIPKSHTAYFDEVIKYFEKVNQLYYKNDQKGVAQLKIIRDSLTRKGIDFLRSSKQKESLVFVHYVLSLLGKAQHLEVSLMPI
jgi:phosphate uptake regulator